MINSYFINEKKKQRCSFRQITACYRGCILICLFIIISNTYVALGIVLCSGAILASRIQFGFLENIVLPFTTAREHNFFIQDIWFVRNKCDEHIFNANRHALNTKNAIRTRIFQRDCFLNSCVTLLSLLFLFFFFFFKFQF